MKIQDLIIGSNLKLDDNRIITITKLTNKNISFVINKQNINNPFLSINDERIMPIELSGSVLRSLENCKEKNEHYIIGSFILRYDSYYEKYIVNQYNCIGFEKHIKYLHELQMLVYVLNGYLINIS